VNSDFFQMSGLFVILSLLTILFIKKNSNLSIIFRDFVSVDLDISISDIWTLFRNFVHVSTVFDISIDDLTLSPGIKYRVVLKLCAKTICFQTVNTDGVMIIANPPVTGGITVEHRNTTQTGGAEKVSGFNIFMQNLVPEFEPVVNHV